MNLEDQVCSLELAKRLKELGVKQESLFYWHHDNGKDYASYGDPMECMCKYDHISAFTVAELGVMFPDYFSSYRENNLWKMGWNEEKWHLLGKFKSGTKNEAYARAMMIVYLLENNLMELPE